MELSEIKSMWQSYDNRLEKALKLNLHCLELIQTQKLRSQLKPLFWYRMIEMTLHAIAAGLLIVFFIDNFSSFSYAASAALLLVFYVSAIVMCLKQIRIIRRMDYSQDIVSIQSSLVMLQTHMFSYARIMVLCIPTFLAYPMVVSKAIRDLSLTGLGFMDIQSGYTGDWWSIQLKITLILIPLCIWFFSQVSYKNIHKHWVKQFIQKTSGTRVRKAIEFVKELDDLKRDV
jgi:hypothetical protein